MSQGPQFEPVLQAHAIERCGISVFFTQPLPDKAFRKVADRVASLSNQIGLQRIEQPAFGFQVDVMTGKVTPATGQGPVSYTTPDQASRLVIDPVSLLWQTSRYIRWAPFIGQFEAILGPVLADYLEVVSPSAVSLEYWDRFVWTNGWDSFDPKQLLRLDTGLIAPAPPELSKREWHSHSGWFEQSDQLRRLVNLNVDVVEVATATSGMRPSVAMYTMMRDDANVQGYPSIAQEELNFPFITGRLESLHLALKKLFANIITDDMAKRIRLESSPSQ